MAAIKNRDTSPEMQIRRELHKAGLRYRLHDRNLPGRPDIVLRRWQAVVFVNGCFWHRHLCRTFRWPESRKTFWKTKLEKNVNRDKQTIRQLTEQGWRVAVIWECSVRGKNRLTAEQRLQSFMNWLKSGSQFTEIPENRQDHVT